MRLLRTPENISSINSCNARETPESHTTSDNIPHQDSSTWSSVLNNSWSSHLNDPWHKAVTLITVAGFPVEETCHEHFDLAAGECSNCLDEDRKKIFERNSEKCVTSESYSSKTSSTPISTDSRRQMSGQKLVSPTVDSGGSSESLVWKLVKKIDSEEYTNVSALATDGKSSLSEFEKRRILEHLRSKFSSEYLGQSANLFRKGNKDVIKKSPTLSESEMTTLDYDTRSQSETCQMETCYKNIWNKTDHPEKASKEYIYSNKKIKNINSDPSEIFDIQLTVKNNSSDSFSNCVVNIRKTGNTQKSSTAMEQEFSDKNIYQNNFKLKNTSLPGNIHSYEQSTNTNNTTSEEFNVRFYNSKKSNESNACNQEHDHQESSHSSTNLEPCRSCSTCKTEQQIRQLLELLSNITLSEKSRLSADKIKNYKNSKPDNKNYNHNSYTADVNSIDKFLESTSVSNSEGETSHLKNCSEPHILKSLRSRLDAEKQIHAANAYCIDLIKYIQNKLDELEQIMFTAKLLENASKNVNLNKPYKTDHEQNIKVAYRDRTVRLLDMSNTTSLKNNSIYERQYDSDNLLRQTYHLYSLGNMEPSVSLQNSEIRASNEQANQTCCPEECTVGKVVRDLQHRISELEQRLNLRPDMDKNEITCNTTSLLSNKDYEGDKSANKVSKEELSVQVPEHTISHSRSAPEIADFDIVSTEESNKNIVDMIENETYEPEGIVHKDKSLEHFKSCTDVSVKEDFDKKTTIDEVNPLEREISLEQQEESQISSSVGHSSNDAVTVNIEEIRKDKSSEDITPSQHTILSMKDESDVLKKNSFISQPSKNHHDEFLTNVLEETKSSASFDKTPPGIVQAKEHKCLAGCNPANLEDKTEQCEKPCPSNLCDKNGELANRCQKISKHSSLELKKSSIIRSDVMHKKDSKSYSNPDARNELEVTSQPISIKGKSSPHKGSTATLKESVASHKSTTSSLKSETLSAEVNNTSLEPDMQHRKSATSHISTSPKRSITTNLKNNGRSSTVYPDSTELSIKTHDYIPVASVEEELIDSELAADDEHVCRAFCHSKDLEDCTDATQRPCAIDLCSRKRTTAAAKCRADQYQTINKYPSLQNMEHLSPIQSREEKSQSLKSMTSSLKEKSDSRRSINRISIGDIPHVKRSSIDQSSKNVSEPREEPTSELHANLKRKSSSPRTSSVVSVKNGADILKKASLASHSSKEALYKFPDDVQTSAEPLSNFQEVEQQRSASLKSASVRSASFITGTIHENVEQETNSSICDVSSIEREAGTARSSLKSTQEKACITDCGSNCAISQKTRCRCCGCTNVVKIEKINKDNIETSIRPSSSEKNIKNIDLTSPNIPTPHGKRFSAEPYSKEGRKDLLDNISETTEPCSEKEITSLDLSHAQAYRNESVDEVQLRSISSHSQNLTKHKSGEIGTTHSHNTITSLKDKSVSPKSISSISKDEHQETPEELIESASGKDTLSKLDIEHTENAITTPKELRKERSSADRSLKDLEMIANKADKFEKTPQSLPELDIESQKSTTSRITIESLRDLYEKRSSIDNSIKNLEHIIQNELNKSSHESKLKISEEINQTADSSNLADTIENENKYQEIHKDTPILQNKPESSHKLNTINHKSSAISLTEKSSSLNRSTISNLKDLFRKRSSIDRSITDLESQIEKELDKLADADDGVKAELGSEYRSGSITSLKDSQTHQSLKELNKKLSSGSPFSTDLHEVIENKNDDHGPEPEHNKGSITSMGEKLGPHPLKDGSYPELVEPSNSEQTPKEGKSSSMSLGDPFKNTSINNASKDFAKSTKYEMEETSKSAQATIPELNIEQHKRSNASMKSKRSTSHRSLTEISKQRSSVHSSNKNLAKVVENELEDFDKMTSLEQAPSVELKNISPLDIPSEVGHKFHQSSSYFEKEITTHDLDSPEELKIEESHEDKPSEVNIEYGRSITSLKHNNDTFQEIVRKNSATQTTSVLPTIKLNDSSTTTEPEKRTSSKDDTVVKYYLNKIQSWESNNTLLCDCANVVTEDTASKNKCKSDDKISNSTSKTKTNPVEVPKSKRDDIISQRTLSKQSHGKRDSQTNTNPLEVSKSKREDIISNNATLKQSHSTRDSETSTDPLGVPISQSTLSKQSHGTQDSETSTDPLGVPKSKRDDIISQSTLSKQSHGTRDSETSTDPLGVPISQSTLSKQSHGTQDSETSTDPLGVPKSKRDDIISQSTLSKQSHGTRDSETSTDPLGVPISQSTLSKQSFGTHDSKTSSEPLGVPKSKKDDIISQSTFSKLSHDTHDSETSTDPLGVPKPIEDDITSNNTHFSTGTETPNNIIIPQEPAHRSESHTIDKASSIKLEDDAIVLEKSSSLLTKGSVTNLSRGDSVLTGSSDKISSVKLSSDLLIPAEQSHLMAVSSEFTERKPGEPNTGLSYNKSHLGPGTSSHEICPTASTDHKQSCACDELIKSMQSKIEALEKFNSEALIKDLLNKMNSLEQSYFQKKDNISKAPHDEVGLFFVTQTRKELSEVPKHIFSHVDAGDFDESDLKEEVASNFSMNSNIGPAPNKSIQTSNTMVKNKEIQSDVGFCPLDDHPVRVDSSDEEQLRILKLFMHSHLCSNCRSQARNVSGKIHIPQIPQTITIEEGNIKKRARSVKCLLINEHRLTYSGKHSMRKDKLGPYREKPLKFKVTENESDHKTSSKLSLQTNKQTKGSSSEEKNSENQKPKRKNHWFLVLCKLCCYK